MGAGTPKADPDVGLVPAPTPTNTRDETDTTIPNVMSMLVVVISAGEKTVVVESRDGIVTPVLVLGSAGTSRAGWSSATRRCEWPCGTTRSLMTLPCMRCSRNYQKPSRRN